MKQCIFLIILLLFFIPGCERNEQKIIKTAETADERPRVPRKFEEIHVDQIVPCVDGGAYVVGLGKGEIWYLRGSVAVKVKEENAVLNKSMSKLTTKKEKSLFALWQSEKALRKDIEDERN